ncbi:hypothetical protein CDAR_312301 [Caerostris darwini]|uniref:Uncharacterized protein n=1 Tax=Caerostris darwini TaxID=1538125 RepID=A0AAV4QUH7_9ARAC|nr:hypothetical protein CDAR_312301 [Caerostris darwini]
MRMVQMLFRITAGFVPLNYAWDTNSAKVSLSVRGSLMFWVIIASASSKVTEGWSIVAGLLMRIVFAGDKFEVGRVSSLNEKLF